MPMLVMVPSFGWSAKPCHGSPTFRLSSHWPKVPRVARPWWDDHPEILVDQHQPGSAQPLGAIAFQQAGMNLATLSGSPSGQPVGDPEQVAAVLLHDVRFGLHSADSKITLTLDLTAVAGRIRDADITEV